MASFPSSMPGLGGRRYLMGSSRQWYLLGLLATLRPLNFVVVLTCNDDHKKVEGLLFRRDPWDSIPIAFNA